MTEGLKAHALPVAAVVAVLVVVWYGLAVLLNAPQVIDQFERDDQAWTTSDLVAGVWSMDSPVLPTPDQITADMWSSVFDWPVSSNRSLVYHAGVTVSAALAGFVLGTLLGIVLAVGIVTLRVLEGSLLPWVIASQTIPILAIAPMVVVVLGNLGITGLVPKAVISMYLCFFPVAVGMVKGLRAPDPLQLDLMATYSASRGQTLRKLRLPASLPYLIASLKVAIAASLVGAIVGELPTGAQAGLGSRLLSGSYFGQTIQIWSALAMAAILGVVLVALVDLAGRLASRALGQPA